MKPLVYIAGPYSKPDPVLNTRRAIDAGMRLWDTGKATPLIPHLSLLAHLVSPRPEETWYALDLEQLGRCDAVWRLPGESVGADAEELHASGRGIPVLDSFDAILGWAVSR